MLFDYVILCVHFVAKWGYLLYIYLYIYSNYICVCVYIIILVNNICMSEFVHIMSAPMKRGRARLCGVDLAKFLMGRHGGFKL